MSAQAGCYDDYDEPFDPDQGSWCESCDSELDINDFVECQRCTGLDRCVDDLCHGAGRCMH